MSTVVPVERCSQLRPEEFEQEFFAGQGRPVIVTDAMDRWNARREWSFDFFAERYGDRTIAIDFETPSGKYQRVMKFAEYDAFIHGRTHGIPGFCVNRTNGWPVPDPPEMAGTTLYLAGKWNAFLTNPELLDDIERTPYFVDDWLQRLPGAFLELLQTTDFRPHWLMFGPEGSLTRLHRDFLHSHAYIAQIVGRKRCRLFSPDDAALIDRDRGGTVQAGPDDLPPYAGATAYDCVVEPGEMLVVPADWRHRVLGLDCSISLGYNFFTRSNFGEYFLALFQKLPELLEFFDKTPEWRERLDVSWKHGPFERHVD